MSGYIACNVIVPTCRILCTPEYDQSPSLDAAKAKEILRLIPDGVVVVNEEQRIVYFNPAAESMFKMKAENVLGRPLDVLIPQEVVDTHHREVRSFLRSEETVRWLQDRRTLRARRSDREAFYYEGTIAKLRLTEGTFLASVLREVFEGLGDDQGHRFPGA